MELPINPFGDTSSKHYKAITEISTDYVPNNQEEYMCDEQREYFRRKLLAWKFSLLYSKEKMSQTCQEAELKFSNIEDMASSLLGLATDARTISRTNKLVERIKGALDRVANNTFGYCSATGEPIGLKRLDARPIATMCIEAQEAHENFEKSHNKYLRQDSDKNDLSILQEEYS